MEQEDQSSLTDHDDYEMILTDQEKEQAVKHAKEQYRKHISWRREQFFKKSELGEREIEEKLDSIGIDEEKVIADANMRKHWANEEIERNKKRKEIEDYEIEQKKNCTAKYFYNLLRINAHKEEKELIVNDDTLPYIKAVCYFLSDDVRFETELGYSLKKGLWVRGVSGLGKTWTLKNVSESIKGKLIIHSIIEIIEKIRSHGSFNIKPDFFKLVIDDVASEESSIVKYYGTEINWFKDFIEKIYLGGKNFNKIIVTTNASFDQIEQKYGFRVRSRIRDMFNVIDVNGTDLRGK